MPLTKRFHRNISYTLASAKREEVYIPFIETDQTSSQRLGVKIMSIAYKNRSKITAKIFNTFYITTGTKAFNGLSPEIRS